MVLFDYNFKRYNFRVILYMLALSFIGILAIWSATNQDKAMISKQIVGIVAGILLMVVFSLIDYQMCIRDRLRISRWLHEMEKRRDTNIV